MHFHRVVAAAEGYPLALVEFARLAGGSSGRDSLWSQAARHALVVLAAADMPAMDAHARVPEKAFAQAVTPAVAATTNGNHDQVPTDPVHGLPMHGSAFFARST
jgi:hypothetical protein